MPSSQPNRALFYLPLYVLFCTVRNQHRNVLSLPHSFAPWFAVVSQWHLSTSWLTTKCENNFLPLWAVATCFSLLDLAFSTLFSPNSHLRVPAKNVFYRSNFLSPFSIPASKRLKSNPCITEMSEEAKLAATMFTVAFIFRLFKIRFLLGCTVGVGCWIVNLYCQQKLTFCQMSALTLVLDSRN